MCFSTLDKCHLSDDEDLLCPFAKINSENKLTCKLIYPVYAENDEVEILPKCFNKMLWRERYSWGRKLDKIKSGKKPKK